MNTAIPTNPEERERWQKDPAAYEAIERLQDAYDELRAALDVRVQETALRLFRGDPIPPRPPERLDEARGRLVAAKAQWAAALADADAMLYRRQQGGE
jgi:hypothetical protein